MWAIDDPRFEQIQLLGRGSMGEVWLAIDHGLRRQVAIKVSSKIEDVERFRREAVILAKLRHQNLVEVHNIIDDSNGYPCIIMDYIDGPSLEQKYATVGAPPKKALRILSEVASCLALVHSFRIVHRDVKPANILLNTSEEAHLADFGLATAPNLPQITRLGIVVGTLGYIAPEVMLGGEATSQSDVWSLGHVLKWLLRDQGSVSDPVAMRFLLKDMLDPDPNSRPTSVEVGKICDDLLRDQRPASMRFAAADRASDGVQQETDAKPTQATERGAKSQPYGRTKVRNGRDPIFEFARMDCLAEIPNDNTTRVSPIVWGARSVSMRGEAYRILRTNIIPSAAQIVAVTSPAHGDGKSVTAANLALSFAESGRATVLLEADLRRPKVSDYFEVDNGIGLTNVLAGQVSISHILQPWGRTGLQILPSGPHVPNPVEALQSRMFVELLQRLRQIFDKLVIDLPPTHLADASVVAQASDLVLLVCRSGKTRRRDLIESRRTLSRADVAPVSPIVNGVSSKGGGYTPYLHYASHIAAMDEIDLSDNRLLHRPVIRHDLDGAGST